MTTVGAVLPLAAAFLYVIATLFVKTSIARGAEARHANVVANVGMAIFLQPLWLIGDAPDALWQPALCGVLFFLGQCTTFAALGRGDVSVATPLLGTKIVFLSLYATVFFGHRAGVDWWLAVALSTVAVLSVMSDGRRSMRRHLAATAGFAISSAAIFAMSDTLIQQWSTLATLGPFLAILGLTNGTCSAAWSARERLAMPPRASWLPLGAMAALLSFQFTLMALSFVLVRDATATNILYASRSIWSVVIAWAVGQRFAAMDVQAGRGAMVRRLVGAILLFAAILLILLP